MSAARILEAALAAGARDAEVYLKRSRSWEVGRASGRVLTRRGGSESGVGLRLVTRDGRVGFAAFSPAERRPTRAELRSWLELARPGSGRVRLPPASAGCRAAATPGTLEPERLDRVARALERGMDQADSHARRAVSARLSSIEVEVRNTRGLESKARIRLASLDAWCLAGQTGRSFGLRETRLSSELETGAAEAFGYDVAERAARCLGGRPMPRPSGEVWLHPAITALLLALLAGELHTGGRRRLGSSLFELRAPLEAPGELPFDGVGRRRRGLILVRRGWLQPHRRSPLTRRSYSEPPAEGIPCLRLEPSSGCVPRAAEARLQLLAASVAPADSGPQLLLSGVSRRVGGGTAPVSLVVPGTRALGWLDSLRAVAGPVHTYPFATTVGARAATLELSES